MTTSNMKRKEEVSFGKRGLREAVLCGTAGGKVEEEPFTKGEGGDRACVLCLGDYATKEEKDEVIKKQRRASRI